MILPPNKKRDNEGAQKDAQSLSLNSKSVTCTLLVYYSKRRMFSQVSENPTTILVKNSSLLT